MKRQDKNPDRITLSCADGIQLQARLFTGNDPIAAILVSSGTGFPQSFYDPIARYLSGRGAAVLTYDYRGIAASRGTWPDPAIDVPDWGRLDMNAAIRFLRQRYPDLPIVHIGHSVGGHLIGFASAHREIMRHALVCCGSGTWYKHWPSRWMLELYFWWWLGPLSIARTGEVRPKGGWRGSPLPRQVFRTWRRWSHQGGYYREELANGLAPNYFGEISGPIRSWIFKDDGIGTARAAKDILDCFPNARSGIISRQPADYGLVRLGHQGCFRPGCEAIWDEWWEWLVESHEASRLVA